MKKYKLIIIVISTVSLIITFLLIYRVYFYKSPSISTILKEIGFAQTNPPNNLASPGSIVVVKEGNENILKIICPCENAFGDSIKKYFIESSSTDIDFSNKLQGNFKIDLSFLDKISFAPQTSAIKEITLKLTNVKVLELPDDAIFKNITNRTIFCTQAINNRLSNGEKVTLIKKVIQADAEYIVNFTNNISKVDSLNIIKDLAIELNGEMSSKESNRIVGKGLYWGVDDDVALGSLKPNELPATGTGNRPRMVDKNKIFKVEIEKVSHNIHPIKQPTNMSCWISVYTMMLSWKENKKYSIDEVLNTLGEPWKSYYKRDIGLPANETQKFLSLTNLKSEPPASYTLETYENWLTNNGPVWIISGDGISSHAKLLVGIFGNNSNDISTFEFVDPKTGEIQRLEMMEFIKEYEKEARFLNNVGSNIPFRIQIIHF